MVPRNQIWMTASILITWSNHRSQRQLRMMSKQHWQNSLTSSTLRKHPYLFLSSNLQTVKSRLLNPWRKKMWVTISRSKMSSKMMQKHPKRSQAWELKDNLSWREARLDVTLGGRSAATRCSANVRCKKALVPRKMSLLKTIWSLAKEDKLQELLPQN